MAAHREAMAGFAEMGTMDTWYAHLSEDELLQAVRRIAAKVSKSKKAPKRAKKRTRKLTEKARTATSSMANA